MAREKGQQSVSGVPLLKSTGGPVFICDHLVKLHMRRYFTNLTVDRFVYINANAPVLDFWSFSCAVTKHGVCMRVCVRACVRA